MTDYSGWGRFLVIAVLLLSFALGSAGLDADALWGDEYYSLLDSGGITPRTWIEVPTQLADRNPWHAPGYFLLLHAYGPVVGWEPVALRTLSLLLGVLSVAGMYQLGKALISETGGIVAALFLGTSAFFVHYTHELRMYTLMAFAIVVTLWAYNRLMRVPSRWVWFLFFVSSALLLYIHYFNALVLAAIGIYHLMARPRNRHWWRVVITLGASGLMFLPWAGVFIDGLAKAAEAETLQIRALSNTETLNYLWQLLGNGFGGMVAVLLILSLGALVVPSARLNRRDVLAIWGIPLLLIGLLLAANTFAQVMHLGRLRYLIIVWPSLMLVLALGVEQMRNSRFGRYIVPVVLIGWIVIGVLTVQSGRVTAVLDGASYTAPTHQLARSMQDHAQPGDFLVFYPPEDLSTWRYRVPGTYYLRDVDNTIVNVRNDDVNVPVDATESVLAAAQSRPRFWLAWTSHATATTLEDFRQGIDSSYTTCFSEQVSPNLTLELHSNRPVCCDPTNVIHQFGNVATLAGYSSMIQTEVIEITLSWVTEAEPNRYSYGLHVENEDNELVAQVDSPLPLVYGCETHTISISDFPPGSYAVKLMVYEWESGIRIPLVSSDETRPTLSVFDIP